MNNALIRLENVTKTFPVRTQDVLVLKSINLGIREGDFVIIFGPSGCGKSTLLHTVLGLEPPTLGRVLYSDNDIYKFSEDNRAVFRKNAMGMVYQQSNWIRALNVQENVAFTATLEGMDTRTALGKAHEILTQVGMAEWELYYPTELSSGRQQKVNLARALITDPNVLIADEPTGNLDHQSSIELLELFVALHNKGKTIIMVTHDIENIGYATHVVQMYDGHILKVFDMHKASHESVVQELVTNKSSTALPPGVKPQAKKPQYAPKQSRADSLLTHIRRNIHVPDPRSLLGETFSSLIKSLRFAVLLVMYAIYKALYMVVSSPLLPRSLSRTLSDGLYQVFSFIGGFDRSEVRSIRSIDLIDLSIKGLFAKKVRTFVTVSGMALGIGAIVFLVSIGYGLEKLVITRVARLEEIKQIDIAPAVASNININDMTIATFESISNVAQVLPVIGVVGTVNYQKSSTDVAVYGVLSDYLKSSALQATRGKFFENNDRSVLVSAQYASSAREPTIASDSAQTDFTDESLVEEGNVVATKQTDDQRTIDLPYNHTREAVVNASLLSVLGLSEKDSLGKTFQISFVATDGLVASGERQITSTSVEYTIIGILPKAKTPVIYVPITDLKQLGVSNYSNVKLVVSDPKKLPVVRSNIEGLGFKTMSVVDTVSQIERLFASARLFLWLVGMVGLGVAVLGMFNTLTVSLLERTREIGMMKALGMRSEEVRELLLTDSMTMSFLGGVLGLMLGYAGGKVVSLVLSVFVITKNMGILNVSSIPSSFAFLILGLSLIVGVLTGLYPAYRATRISALDALRYE